MIILTTFAKKLLIVASLALIMFGCSLGNSNSSLKRAEELSRQEKYDEAITAYREHMEKRLDLKQRPEWENPYFYLILIGDIQLGQNKVKEALKTYEEAEKKGVYNALVADRYRSVAEWYEKKDKLETAFKLLKRYRDRDPLLFDAMLDRLAREIVRREDCALNKNCQSR